MRHVHVLSIVPGSAYMAIESAAVVVEQGGRERGTPFGGVASAWRMARRKPLGAVSAVIIVVLVLSAVFAELLAPYGPYELGADTFQSPSAFHLMGTDEIGRDVFSRVLYGARVSLTVGLIAVGLGTMVGSLVGLVSGYFGGALDTVLQRVVDVVMAFPGLVLALVEIWVLGTGTLK